MLDKWCVPLYDKTIEELEKKSNRAKHIAAACFILWGLCHWVMIIQYIFIGYIGATVIFGVCVIVAIIMCLDQINDVRKIQDIMYIKTKNGEK